jgi:hypothetical protein
MADSTKKHVENFVASAQSDDHATAKSEFDAVIASKVSDAFEAKKIELGNRISASSSNESVGSNE